ncbi:MAG: VOC family protein [Candidatus Brocadiae bacterium]|nr:VOC family protein [Candidatus Brocadiia bacterium]
MPASLSAVMIFVADVDASAAFYQRHFGFKPRTRTRVPGEFLQLEAGGACLTFHKAWGKQKGPTGSPNHPFKIVLRVPRVAAARRRLVAAGVKMGEVKRFGTVQFCDGRDAEGHVFQISNRT